MTGLTIFGDPTRFAISVGWTNDDEPHDRRPKHGGWSMGRLGLTIGGQSLTRHSRAGVEQETVTWYLLPVFEWMAKNWIALLHEERFAWRENSAAPAATATFFALRRLFNVDDATGRMAYRNCREWWMRHALRAADSSALYPDLYCRRLGDAIELSWTARQPDYAPDGFRFVLEPGTAILNVEDVAGPLWEALAWFATTAPAASIDDRAPLERIENQLSKLRNVPTASLEAGFLPSPLLDLLTAAIGEGRGTDTSDRMDTVPAIARLDDRVLMFGGVSPEIDSADFDALLRFLASHVGDTESEVLSNLVDETVGPPLMTPHAEGYDLAEYLLEDLGQPSQADSVDVAGVLTSLDVTIEDIDLKTDTIRGVAIAGGRYRPAILVNRTSAYNRGEAGRRFTLAHELFHILYDRTRARRVAHTSGPWAAPGVEKRANAFAAMFLMPRALVRKSLPNGPQSPNDLAQAASIMKVSPFALLEHLYNTDVIDTVTRDRLRLSMKSA